MYSLYYLHHYVIDCISCYVSCTCRGHRTKPPKGSPAWQYLSKEVQVVQGHQRAPCKGREGSSKDYLSVSRQASLERLQCSASASAYNWAARR
jgi:hypothetical protein